MLLRPLWRPAARRVVSRAMSASGARTAWSVAFCLSTLHDACDALSVLVELCIELSGAEEALLWRATATCPAYLKAGHGEP